MRKYINCFFIFDSDSLVPSSLHNKLLKKLQENIVFLNACFCFVLLNAVQQLVT